MPENKPELKLADPSASDKPKSGLQATGPEAESPKPAAVIPAGDPAFQYHDVVLCDGALAVVIGRGQEMEGNHLHWRYFVQLPDAGGKCNYTINAGSWVHEGRLKSLEDQQRDLKDSATNLRL